MIALQYTSGALALREISQPHRDDEATVRVRLSGICSTDMEIARGYAGFEGTLGHEFVGTVVASPGEKLIGRRVVGEINAGCGRCELCAAGDSRHCERRTVLGILHRDGSHAEYLQLPLVNLLPVPDEVSDRHAVFTEPLAAACGILDRVTVADLRVAVVGDGKLGLLCAKVLALAGARTRLIGKHPEKLQIAEDWKMDATTAESLQAKGMGSFDVVVEASGSRSGFGLALDLLRPRGVLVLKSTFFGSTDVDASKIVVDEISVVGSRCGRFGPALKLLKEGSIDLEMLISGEYPLSEGTLAMQRAGEKDALKILLKP